jgi:hypothetical protein
VPAAASEPSERMGRRVVVAAGAPVRNRIAPTRRPVAPRGRTQARSAWPAIKKAFKLVTDVRALPNDAPARICARVSRARPHAPIGALLARRRSGVGAGRVGVGAE